MFKITNFSVDLVDNNIKYDGNFPSPSHGIFGLQNSQFGLQHFVNSVYDLILHNHPFCRINCLRVIFSTQDET